MSGVINLCKIFCGNVPNNQNRTHRFNNSRFKPSALWIFLQLILLYFFYNWKWTNKRESTFPFRRYEIWSRKKVRYPLVANWVTEGQSTEKILGKIQVLWVKRCSCLSRVVDVFAVPECCLLLWTQKNIHHNLHSVGLTLNIHFATLSLLSDRTSSTKVYF